jgi:SAM-dependent methyltransferase
MDDPIQRHPTRTEQLDILVRVLADSVPDGGHVLDLGCGTGYIDWMLLQRRGDLRLTGMDFKPESLAEAKAALADWTGQVTLLQADLMQADGMSAAGTGFDAAFTALVFHDLDDAAKQACIRATADRLKPGGVFLVYDRVRLTEAACFPLQQAVWRRIEQEHGVAMRDATDFDAYQADLASNNRPATLQNYFDWMPAAGLSAQLLHLHGNVMLMGGVKPA